MRTTTIFAPLAFALTATAINLSFGPDTVCGDNSVNCNNGFCCFAGNKCDTSGTITKCGTDGTPALPFGVGDIASAVQSHVQSAGDAAKSAINDIPLSSLAADLSSLATAFPTSAAAALSSLFAGGNIPTDAAGLSSIMTALPSAARPAVSSLVGEIEGALGVTSASGAAQPKKTGDQGAAAAVGAGSFGSTAVMVAGIWGAAAVGGAMLVL